MIYTRALSALAILCILKISGSAKAEDAPRDIRDCQFGKPEIAIPACSKLIESHSKEPAILAAFLRLRRNAEFDLRNYDRAKADADALIATGFTVMEDWQTRGNINTWLNDWESAYADFAKAHSMAPFNQQIAESLATASIETKRYREAIVQYDLLIASKLKKNKKFKKDKKHAEYLRGRGLAYGWLQKYALALDNYKLAVTYDRNNSLYWYEWGYYLFESGDSQAAKLMLDKAIDLSPTDVDYRHRRGLVLQDLGQAVEAIADYDFVLSKDDRPWVRSSRASLLLDIGEYDKAKADLDVLSDVPELKADRAALLVKLHFLQGLYEYAQKLAVEEIGRSPENNDARYWLARTQNEVGQHSEAVLNYSILAEVWKSNQFLKVHRAKSYFALGKRDEAFADTKDGLSDPNSAHFAREIRAGFYRSDGRWKEAIRDYDVLISVDQKNGNLLFDRGNARWNIGDTAGADADYQLAAQLNPEDSYLLSQWAALLAEMGKLDEALEKLRKAEELSPDNPYVQKHRGWYHQALGDFTAAEAAYTRGIDLKADDPWAYESRSWARAMLNNPVGAIADCQEMANLLPKSPYSFLCMAFALREARRYDEGISELNKALEQSPEFDRAYFERGILYSYTGRYQEAAEDFSTAIAFDYKKPAALAWRGDALKNLNLVELAARSYREAAALGDKELAQSMTRRLNQMNSVAVPPLDDESVYPQARR